MSEDFPEPGNLGVKDQPGSETLTRVDRQDACVQTSMDTTEDDLIIPPAIEIPSDASNQPPKFNAKRHDELWFDDGDLVLIAGGIEFRVYKEPLLVHSPILRDMLLADGEGSATDGAHISHENDNKQPVLAILRLSDSPEDLEHFLQGFFPGRTLRVGMCHPTIHEISARIRLGRKYQVGQMVEDSMEYLDRYFPNVGDAKKWDHLDCRNPPTFEAIHAVSVVNLARLTGKHSLLPAALLACSYLGKALVPGYTRPDGTQETLSMDDVARCIAGRAAFSLASAAATHEVFQPKVAEECTRPGICEPVFRRIMRNLAADRSTLFGITFRSRKNPWTAAVEKNDPERVLCPKCYDMIGRSWDSNSGRQAEQITALLAKLPQIFNLKGNADDEDGSTTVVSTSQEPSTRDIGMQAGSCSRDEELWFKGGNLTLITTEIEFRVWKAPLIAHSPVFRDMLSLPQNEDADTLTDVTPSPNTTTLPAVVHLSDSHEDLRCFLRVFFPDKSLGLSYPAPAYHALSAQIRLGHKYQVDQMVQRNLEHLQRYYTDDPDLWWREADLLPPRFLDEHTIGVVNLARLTSTRSMLSTALLGCADLRPETITQGFVRPDGSRETLCSEDIGRCLSGKHTMIEATILGLHKVFSQGPAKSCTRVSLCRPIIQRMLEGVVCHGELESLSNTKWWGSWKTYVERVDDDRKLCWKCYKVLTQERKFDVERASFTRLSEDFELQEPEEGD